MTTILNLPITYSVLLILIIIIIAVDALTAFRYYYINKWYSYLNLKLDSKRLDYYKGIVIHGYKTLASEEAITQALEKYKELALELEVDEFDFQEYKETYNKQIKDVLNRGYF